MLDDLGFEYLYEQNVQTCSRAHLVSYSMDIRGSFVNVKWPKCEPNHSSPTSVKVKNKCSSPLHAFGVYRVNFTFYLFISHLQAAI